MMKVGLSAIVLVLLALPPVHSAPLPRPDVDNAALFARWLLNQSYWGILSTVDIDSGGFPFGNVHSVVDGGTGSPYFYQSLKFDRTGKDLMVDGRSSFSVSEYALEGSCKDDPQSPKCAKLTLLGQLRILEKNSSEADYWEAVLLEKHPQFKGFPKAQGFDVIKLDVTEVYLVNKPAFAINVSLPEYFAAQL